MPAAVLEPPVAAASKRCRGCGVVKGLASFAPHSECLYGVDSRCRSCRRSAGRARIARERDRRLPDLLGLSDPRDASQSILAALRVHYDGRPVRLLSDLLLALNEADAATRVNAALVLLGFREIASLARQVSLRDDPLAALAELPDGERVALARKLVPSGWTVEPPG